MAKPPGRASNSPKDELEPGADSRPYGLPVAAAAAGLAFLRTVGGGGLLPCQRTRLSSLSPMALYHCWSVLMVVVLLLFVVVSVLLMLIMMGILPLLPPPPGLMLIGRLPLLLPHFS